MRDELNVAYVTHANILNNYLDTIGPNLNSFHPVRCSWENVITQTIDCGMGRLASERYGPLLANASASAAAFACISCCALAAAMRSASSALRFASASCAALA